MGPADLKITGFDSMDIRSVCVDFYEKVLHCITNSSTIFLIIADNFYCSESPSRSCNRILKEIESGEESQHLIFKNKYFFIVIVLPRLTFELFIVQRERSYHGHWRT
jgi:hypothetical protein